MLSKDIRKTYIEFFKSKAHKHLRSSSLVPEDPTLLTTSAGMVQFKPFFLGIQEPEYKRVTTHQKCLRAVDIEEVGRTPRHHTFFEMLGNFSFGDYFKKEVIHWAWEFLTQILKIQSDNLWISVYKDDKETANIWSNEIGIPSNKLFYFGEKENFWPASAPSIGPNGPCGPCSEIFYDFGKERGCRRSTCDIACNCDRFIEIWNLVFMEFERKDGGILSPLPKKNIDTGMGLERMASVLQEVTSNFETDLFLPIIENLQEISRKTYKHSTIPFRVIADHIRGITFLLSDGVFPSNEGRGYLLRKIIRRASSAGREIGISSPFLSNMLPVVLKILGNTYPEITGKEQYITQILQKEEEQFHNILERGRRTFIAELEKEKKLAETPMPIASGITAFVIYDTYGLPLEESEKIAKEMGFAGVDIDNFNIEMEKQKARARESSKMDGTVFSMEQADSEFNVLAGKITSFVGYETLSSISTVIAILENGKMVKKIDGVNPLEPRTPPSDCSNTKQDKTVQIVFDTTPFYVEMGGQVGDKGFGKSPRAKIKIDNTVLSAIKKISLHNCRILVGSIEVGDIFELYVDADRRKAIERHHTATHLLHYALRQILGEHVIQSGSYVGPEKLRFDFTHYSFISESQQDEIENLINKFISNGYSIDTYITTYETARNRGVTALFGEKYEKDVRVVDINNFSRELCGGTHLKNTNDILLFKIVDEHSIGSNIRRIEAVAGLQAFEYVKLQEKQLKEIGGILNTQIIQIPVIITDLISENKQLKSKINSMEKEFLKLEVDKVLSSVDKNTPSIFITHTLQDANIEKLRTIYDMLKNSIASYGILLAAYEQKNNKVSFLMAFSDDLVAKGADAGNTIKKIAEIVGGSGGGSKKLAQAGGKQPEKLSKAIEFAAEQMKQLKG